MRFQLLGGVTAVSAHPCFKESFPELLQAMQLHLKPEEVDGFLEPLTEDECFLLYAKLDGTLARASGRTEPTQDFMYAHYGSHLFGLMGEVFATGYARQRLEPGEFLLDEWYYDQLNPQGNKPDGVVYRLEGKDLIITRVLESKMGSSKYSNVQSAGYLKTWKQHGLVYDEKGRSIKVTPKDIFMMVDGKVISIEHATDADLKKITTLFGTSSIRNSVAEYVRVPFSATTARVIIYEYMGLLLKSLPPRPKEASHVPVLAPQEVPDFASALVDFIVENGRWPKGSGKGLEKFLAKEISLRGGQVAVFEKDIGPGLRHFFDSIWSRTVNRSIAAESLRK